MGLIDHAEVVLRQRVAAFAERGFTLIPDALSAAELSSLNRAIDDDRARHYDQWLKRGARESGRTQSVDLLTATPDFDAVCAHPAVLPTVCFEEFSAMVREPVLEAPPLGQDWHHKAWHRDGGRHVLSDPLLLWKAQVIFYLSDVDETTHCFSIVPESVSEKRALRAEPDLECGATVVRTREPAQPLGESRGIDIYGKAGTAIVVNSANVHAGTVRQKPHERRTLHIYYGRATQLCVAHHTPVPRRLVESSDTVVRHLFGRRLNNSTLELLGLIGKL